MTTDNGQQPKRKRAPRSPMARVKMTAGQVARAEARVEAAKARRDAAIADAYDEGTGTRKIAVAAGLSNSGVRKILGIGEQVTTS